MQKEFNLDRFIMAQQRDYLCAFQEIKNGKKESHWIWYIFPQLKELGNSFPAKYYGIDGIEEATAYWQNEYLRNNLVEITRLLLRHQDKSAYQIMGEFATDEKKLRSCMTLFSMVEGNDKIFSEVIDIFFDGKPDSKTLDYLQKKQK